MATRYAVPVDLAVLFGAAIGAGRLAEEIAQSRRGSVAARDGGRRDGRDSRMVGRALAAAVLAAACAWPPALLASATRTAAADARQLARNELASIPALDAALAGLPGSRDLTARPGQRQVVLYVPVPMRTLLAADLGMPLTRLGSTSAGGLSGPPGLLDQTDLWSTLAPATRPTRRTPNSRSRPRPPSTDAR